MEIGQIPSPTGRKFEVDALYFNLIWLPTDLVSWFFCVFLGLISITIINELQAALVVADKHQSLQITGNGDVLEPHDGIIAIGSGSPYALAAARALIDIPGLNALTIARKAMTIAADACIYTNKNFTALHINGEGKVEPLEDFSPISPKENLQ